jgi:hypothetical protein
VSEKQEGTRGSIPRDIRWTREETEKDNSNFPWILWEQWFNVQFNGCLGKTLKLLMVFMRDPKFVKLSIIRLLQVPPFPHLE